MIVNFTSDPIFTFSYVFQSLHFNFVGYYDVGEGCWWKTCMLVKTKLFSWKYFSPTYRKIFTNTLHQHTFSFLFIFFTNMQKKISPTYFTNIHLNFRSKFSPTYSTFHQHTVNFSPTYFTNIHLNFCIHQHTASPTYRKFFTNILFFANIFHQHHYSHFLKPGLSGFFKDCQHF